MRPEKVKALSVLISGITISLLLGCHSSGNDTPSAPLPIPTAPHATKLIYTEPTSTDWHFTRILGSGSAHDPLILELRGPSNAAIQGAAFTADLGATSKATWHAFSESIYAQASSNLDLGNEPRLFKTKFANGVIQVGAFQKTGYFDPDLGVVRVALQLADANQTVGNITITPKNIAVLSDTGEITSPAFSFGTLKAE